MDDARPAIPDHLRIRPGQQELTPEQKEAARQFTQERIAAQLSTQPVDEAEAEEWLGRTYVAMELTPPAEIRWLDSPRQLVDLFLAQWQEFSEPPQKTIGTEMEQALLRVSRGISASIPASLAHDFIRAVSVRPSDNNRNRGTATIEAMVSDGIGERVHQMRADFRKRVSIDPYNDGVFLRLMHSGITSSVAAYRHMGFFSIIARFFDEFYAPNGYHAHHALMQFNEMASGYWLSRDRAIVVRKPRLLSRDSAGRLHNATGKALEYPDGWGFYAWHGVRVPKKVILRPDALNRDDFLGEPNAEARRVIQERMGQRFVPAIGGTLIDEGPRGRLWEVRLAKSDPERIAHYVQVKDASTPREYYLRVPPTIQTADEAVAWTFGMTVEQYLPGQEA